MKINSNTVSLEQADFNKIEDIVKKVAADNNIANVENVRIKLSSNEAIVSFKTQESNNL